MRATHRAMRRGCCVKGCVVLTCGYAAGIDFAVAVAAIKVIGCGPRCTKGALELAVMILSTVKAQEHAGAIAGRLLHRAV